MGVARDPVCNTAWSVTELAPSTNVWRTHIFEVAGDTALPAACRLIFDDGFERGSTAQLVVRSQPGTGNALGRAPLRIPIQGSTRPGRGESAPQQATDESALNATRLIAVAIGVRRGL